MINWTALFIYLFVLCITPGPNNINCLYLAARGGFSAVKKFMLGSMSALACKTLICGSLNVLLAKVMPTVTTYLKWAGAAYMLYFAWHMAKSGWEEEKDSDKAFGATAKSGILLQVLNGKSWVAALSLYAVYIIPYTQSFVYVLIAAIIFVAFASAASFLWAGMGVAIRGLITKYKKPFGIIMGLGLLYCAVSAVI